MNIEWILVVLPWLALLACPVLMFWMMRGMHGGTCGKEHAPDGSAAARAPDAKSPDGRAANVNDELVQLRQRLAQLEAQRPELDAETYR